MNRTWSDKRIRFVWRAVRERIRCGYFDQRSLSLTSKVSDSGIQRSQQSIDGGETLLPFLILLLWRIWNFVMLDLVGRATAVIITLEFVCFLLFSLLFLSFLSIYRITFSQVLALSVSPLRSEIPHPPRPFWMLDVQVVSWWSPFCFLLSHRPQISFSPRQWFVRWSIRSFHPAWAPV